MITGIASTMRIVIIQNDIDAMKIIVLPSKSTNSMVRIFRIYKISRVVYTQAIFFLKSMSERVGSDMQRLLI